MYTTKNHITYSIVYSVVFTIVFISAVFFINSIKEYLYKPKKDIKHNIKQEIVNENNKIDVTLPLISPSVEKIKGGKKVYESEFILPPQNLNNVTLVLSEYTLTYALVITTNNENVLGLRVFYNNQEMCFSYKENNTYRLVINKYDFNKQYIIKCLSKAQSTDDIIIVAHFFKTTDSG